MTNDTYDWVLADWIICELPEGRFLAGKVTGDRKVRFDGGVYIATSVVTSPLDEIVDGNIIEAEDGRYLLTERNTTDAALFAKLDEWLKEQPTRPMLADVVASDDTELLAAYILRGFRKAAAEAYRKCKKG